MIQSGFALFRFPLSSPLEASPSDAFMPEEAPFVALSLLATAFLLFVAALGGGIALLARRRGLARKALGAAAALAMLYGGVLLAVSFSSRERTLVQGERKYFCSIDCHLAYSVESVTAAKALGPSPRSVRARGRFLVVAVRTWFDERTITPHRGNFPLRPDPRRVFVADPSGRRFERDDAGGRALQEMGRKTAPLTQPLRPGESYVTELVFDLPEDLRNARLFLGDCLGLTFFLIGHEDSLFHKKIYFRLDLPESVAGSGSPASPARAEER